jgi:hypothetical protein
MEQLVQHYKTYDFDNTLDILATHLKEVHLCDARLGRRLTLSSFPT